MISIGPRRGEMYARIAPSLPHLAQKFSSWASIIRAGEVTGDGAAALPSSALLSEMPSPEEESPAAASRQDAATSEIAGPQTRTLGRNGRKGWVSLIASWPFSGPSHSSALLSPP